MPGLWTDLSATSIGLTFNLGAYIPGDDEIIAFGGGFAAETRSFNGTAWSDPAPATTPPALTEHGMAYDGVGALMFGGFELGSGIMNPPETWRYAAGDWSQLSPATSPGPKDSPMMCDIPGGALLFGGGPHSGPNPHSDETWRWDQSTWTQLSPATPPSPRSSGQMGYLPGVGVVLFGGTDDSATVAFGDTWLFDLGTEEWTDLTGSLTTSPAARFLGALAYDGTALTLFGGRIWPGSGPSVFRTNQTWTLDMSEPTWCSCGIALPSARDSIGMVYDSTRERAVTWSGNTGSGTTADDTWAFEGTCCADPPPDPFPAALRATFGLG